MGRLSGNVAGELARLLRWGTATGENDDRLLERFLANRDESAFAALVARHGPMVLGVCRRVLRDEHDVEDAFQATFLVLARNARTIRRSERVGPWLHGVARRVAVRAKVNSARRLARERSGIDVEPSGDASPSRDPERTELRAILDEELNGLPESLRAPLILCYLEGLTHDQAASRLSQPVGTIRSRLSRGRERLRVRLARRGVRADDAALGAAAALEAVSPALLESTVRSALEFAVSQTGASALASAGAVALAKGVLNAMMISKWTLTSACALGLVLTAGGLSGYAFQQEPEAERAEPEAANDAPKDDSSPLSAVKSRLAKIQSAMTDLDERRRKDDETLSSIVKQLDELRNQLERASGEAKPEVASSSEQPAAADDDRPRYLDPDQPIAVPSKNGHVVTFFGALGGRPPGAFGGGVQGAATRNVSVRLAEAGSPRLEVTPRILSSIYGFVAALGLRGERGERLAVLSTNSGGWSVQELSEPVTEAKPVEGASALVYVLGRRIYAYSYVAKRWSVLELPEGARPEAPPRNFNGLRLEYEGIVYSYNPNSGQWTEFDTGIVPDEAEGGESSGG